MRILVYPERLLDLSRQIGQEAAHLREIEGRLGRALGGLDWSVRQQANVDGWVYDARNRARALAERAEGIARFLVDRAQAFQQADQESYSHWDTFRRVCTRVPPPHFCTDPPARKRRQDT
ncbi:MAG: WXG100 family type VII secretion target, partial [Anaerolineae bacterium]